MCFPFDFFRDLPILNILLQIGSGMRANFSFDLIFGVWH